MTGCEVEAAQILWFGAGGGRSLSAYLRPEPCRQDRSSPSGRRPLCDCEARAWGAWAQRRVLRWCARTRGNAIRRTRGYSADLDGTRNATVTSPRSLEDGRPRPGTIRQARSPAAPRITERRCAAETSGCSRSALAWGRTPALGASAPMTLPPRWTGLSASALLRRAGRLRLYKRVLRPGEA